MKKLIGLLPTPTDDEPFSIVSLDVNTGHYDDTPEDALLPAEGEDVWIDHPAFKQCTFLREALAACGNDWFMETMNGRDAAQLDPIAAWLSGSTPIPEKEIRSLLAIRDHLMKREGIPAAEVPPIRAELAPVD